ncbi:hypothetical protein ACE6H2_014603 [Prunus campanulata]
MGLPDTTRMCPIQPTLERVCHVCFVCCVGGNLKHCGKCLQSYNLQCLNEPHKEKKHIEVSGTRQIPIKTVPTSLDEVPSQRDAYGNKSSGKKVGSSSNANAGALVDDNNVGRRSVSQLVMNSAVITDDFVRQKISSSAAAFERKSSSECDGSSPSLNTSNLEDTDSFSRNKLDKFGGDSAASYEETSPENCSVDHEADLKHSRENLLVSYNLIAYFIHRVSLMHEEEQLHDEEKTGSDALQQAGEVLGQSAQSAMDVEVLCMDHLRKSSDTRDSSSEAATLCKPGKTQCEETWKGQLGCYVKGSKIALLIMKGGRDLAEWWAEEQTKLLSGICVPQFKYSTAQGSSLDYHYFLGPKTGIWKENTADEPGLSFGNVDACRGGNGWRRPLFQPVYVCNNDNEHLQRPISYTKRTSHFGFRTEKYDEDEFSIFSRSRCMAKGNLL